MLRSVSNNNNNTPTNMATDRTVVDDNEFEYLTDNPSIEDGNGLKLHLSSESDDEEQNNKSQQKKRNST